MADVKACAAKKKRQKESALKSYRLAPHVGISAATKTSISIIATYLQDG
jgi:hypothetical protein